MRRACLAAFFCVLLGTGPTAVAQTHSVPPPAPKPTSSGSSPDAPDPHPPLGGIGPDGRPVGGAELLNRGLILPPHVPPLPPNLTAQAWILTDLDTGAVLAARDPHGRYQPASILKLLTSVTLLPLLPGKRVVTAGADAANAEGSAVGLVAGGRYTVDQLFTGLLLMSGNDAAIALADAAGGYAHTVALMNKTALRLGAYDTFVQTPSGLDGWQQLTSAYDMAIFLRAAVNMPRFVAYDRQPTGLLPPQDVQGRAWPSVPLANQSENFLTSVPGALIAKTGFTDAAQHTYACAASRDGRRLGVIFLRAQRYPIDQWQQAAELLDWGYRLPRSASVGELAPPVQPPAKHTATPTPTPSPAEPTETTETPTTITSQVAAPRPPTKEGGLPVAALAAIAAAGAAILALGARKLTRR